MIDTRNRYAVSVNGRGDFAILNPPIDDMSKEEALVLAAWLVALADPYDRNFQSILNEVRNT